MTEPVSFPGALKIGFAGLAATLLLSVQVKISAQQSNAASAGPSPTSSQRQFLDRYCATCHNEQLKSWRPESGPGRLVQAWRAARTMGEGGAQAAHGRHAASQHAAAFRGRSPRDVDMAGNIARCGVGRKAESRPHRNAATPESNRVSERDQGPAGARHRRRLASAGR